MLAYGVRRVGPEQAREVAAERPLTETAGKMILRIPSVIEYESISAGVTSPRSRKDPRSTALTRYGEQGDGRGNQGEGAEQVERRPQAEQCDQGGSAERAEDQGEGVHREEERADPAQELMR